MSTNLSRRGLFKAFRSAKADCAEVADSAACIARISDACVEPKGVMCRRCGDECDVRAIRFRPLGQGRMAVHLDSGLCTGCGACLPVCPASAITLIPAERAALMAGIATLGATA